MYPLIKYCFVVAVGLSISAIIAEAQGMKASKADEMFLKDAMQGDLAEVNMGKLAQEKAQSQGVKDFGKMLEQDHGEHSQKVQSKAQELGVTAPQEPNTTQKSMYDRLSKLSGGRFDEQFVEAMVTDHKKDIAEYDKEAKSKSPLADHSGPLTELLIVQAASLPPELAGPGIGQPAAQRLSNIDGMFREGSAWRADPVQPSI
jgi:putative membrane protein